MVGIFTGLVSRGTVVGVEPGAEGTVLTVRSPLVPEAREGDSIAVNGVCLTATRVDGETFIADVMHETLRRSSLGALDAGSPVNVELPVRAQDRLGGHLVQGHVDGTGRVTGVEEDGFARRVRIAPDDPGLLRYVVEKGSIAVDGVSLTVTSVDDAAFAVSLIPETLERTNLGAVVQGARVNLEVDVLAKYVEKLSSAGRARRGVVRSEAEVR